MLSLWASFGLLSVTRTRVEGEHAWTLAEGAEYPSVIRTGLSRQLVATPIDANGNYTNISSVISWTKFSKVSPLNPRLLYVY